MDAQVRDDGSHFEQSSYYHVYALDMLKFSSLLEEMPADYTAKLTRMEDYLDALLGPQRRLPFIGDDDGGRFFHPYGPRDTFGVASLAPGWAFLSESGAPAAASGSRLFENAGIAIMQHGDTQLIADAGPMGPGGAGHSHADALSLVLRRGEEDLLIDAGTFTYVGDVKWRNWFRGAAAHNTIRIDGLEQATPVGPFRWADKPEVHINQWDEDFLDAECRYRGFVHRRKILFAKPDTILIVDECTANGATTGSPHLLEQFWHSGEHVTQESPHAFRLGRTTRLLLSQDATLEVGGTNGWRSRVFGSKEPAPVICAATKQELPFAFAAVIDLSGEAQSFQLSEDGEAITVTGAHSQQYSLKRP
jgi:hypothetical protein